MADATLAEEGLLIMTRRRQSDVELAILPFFLTAVLF
jgi:hypothetical protein